MGGPIQSVHDDNLAGDREALPPKPEEVRPAGERIRSELNDLLEALPDLLPVEKHPHASPEEVVELHTHLLSLVKDEPGL